MAGNLPSQTADTNLGCAGTITGSESTGQNFENEFDTRAIYFDGTYEYWGGSFTKFGSTGNASQYVLNSPTTRNRILAIVDSTKALASWNPNADGEVFCIVPGPAGKLYVAGSFGTINSVSRSKLALIGDASGSPTVDTTFTSFGTINGRITGLYYDAANNQVYISGQFTTVNGTTRNRVAKLDGTTGALDSSFNPNVTGGGTDCRRVIGGVHSTDLTSVYLAGEFTTVGGTAGLLGLCAVAKSNGALAAWRPTLSGDSTSTLPHDVCISPDGTFLIVAIAGSGNGEPGGGNGNAIVRYELVVAGSLSRTNAQTWHQFADGDGGDHNACATDGVYVAAGHHGDGSQTVAATTSRQNHKIYLVNAADGSTTNWIPNPEPNSIQGTYAIRLYDDRMLVGHVWTRPTQGMSRYARAGTGGGGGGGGGAGWAQVYESRMPLGGAAKTNFGPGQQGRTLYHQTQQAPGTSSAISATTWGYGKYAAITLALTTSGGGGDTTPPTVPGSLVATATGANTAHLAWNASTDASGVLGYTIYRGAASVTTVTTTTFNDAGLNPGQTYVYTVDAFDAAGNHSAQSSPSTITTPATQDTTPPTNPTGLTASITGSHVTLTWTASTDANGVAGYNIFRSGVPIAVQTGTVYVDVSGTPGTSYTYTVSAFDAVPNTSGLSNTQTVTYPTVVAGITIRNRISESTNGTTNVGNLIPIGTQIGDFIIATIRVSAQNLTITPPAGWTPIQLLNPGSPITQQTFYRTYQNGDDVSTWVWTWSGSHAAQMSMLSLIGASGLDTGTVGRTSTTTYPLQISAATLQGPSDFLYFTGSSLSPITGSLGNGFTALEPGGQTEPPGIEILSGYINPATSGTNGPYTTTISATNNRFVGSLIGVLAGNPVIVNQGPIISVVAPANGVTVNATTITFQVTANDPDGIASIVVNTLSGPVSLTPVSVDSRGNGTYAGAISLLTSASPGSQNNFTVTATDSNVSPLSTTSSNVSVFGVQNTADTSPPTIVWDTPASGTDKTVQGADDFDYGISFSASDPSGLGAFTLDTPVFTALPIEPDASGNFFVNVALNTGTNAFTLHTLDTIGNAGTVSFTITLAAPDAVDVTGPTVTIATPVGTFTVVGPNGTIYTVNGVANDPSGVASVIVNGVAQTLSIDEQSAAFSAPIALTTGNNALTVVATDSAVAQTAIQTVSITGTPTGGTFKLTYSGQQTGTIAYNASASTVQTALEALSNIGVGEALCTGGSLPGTPVVVTFAGTLANLAQTTMTTADSLTGGTAPASHVSATQVGNPGSNQTTVSRTIVLEDTAGPTITVTTPAATSITITGDAPYLYETVGTVTSSNGLTLFTVDSVPVTVATDGSWAQIISLTSGMNDVVFQAVDSLNNVTLLTYEVTLEPPAPGAEGAFNLSTDQQRMAQRLQDRGTE